MVSAVDRGQSKFSAYAFSHGQCPRATSENSFAFVLGRHAGVAIDEAVLHLDGAAHGVDNAAELDKNAVSGALDDAPVMRGDGGVDHIAAQPRSRDKVRSSSAPASRL